jgi:hypothetical protein
MLRVISLGAGVQSTTMALMAAHGELTPMPDCAIFADTGWEPKAVYKHLEWLIGGVLPFPVHVVSAGNIRDDLIARSRPRESPGRFITAPFFLLRPDGQEGMGRRQCTGNYKIEPIYKKTRELLGKGPRDYIAPSSVEQWVGISVDEIFRATLSKVKYAVKRFPLIEKRMSRRDCVKWLTDFGYKVPAKSACIGCPYHDNATWRDMRDNRPDEWADAIAVDKAIRAPIDYRAPALRSQQFMHPTRVPLDEVDLSTAEDHGQLDLFNNECEGLCGV